MHYHLIGIQGVSMSGLADVLRKCGHIVTGSDTVLEGHRRANITADIDEVIASKAAVFSSAPAAVEIAEAKHLGIPVIERSQAIGKFMEGFTTIAIAGTHGKTTVTTLIGRALEELGQDPMVLVGGEVEKWQGTSRFGSGKYFVVEACEYERQFLDFPTTYGVLTGVEADHFDTYKDIKELTETFEQWASQIYSKGLLIACGDSDKVRRAARLAKCQVIYYGCKREDNNYKLANFEEGEDGSSVIINGKKYHTKLSGAMNALNTTAVVALLCELGFAEDKIIAVLSRIENARRRMEIIGEAKGILVIDDYGHHPTELAVTIKAIKQKYLGRRLIVVFEPHQISRTQAFIKEFAKALSKADMSFILPVYLVAGRDDKMLSKLNLHKQIAENVKNCSIINNYNEALDSLKKSAKEGDIVLTIGATPVFTVGRKLMSWLRQFND